MNNRDFPRTLVRYRLASLVAHVGENRSPNAFLPLRSLLVRVPVVKHIKNKTTQTGGLIFGGPTGTRTPDRPVMSRLL